MGSHAGKIWEIRDLCKTNANEVLAFSSILILRFSWLTDGIFQNNRFSNEELWGSRNELTFKFGKS